MATALLSYWKVWSVWTSWTNLLKSLRLGSFNLALENVAFIMSVMGMHGESNPQLTL
jgi:hypothetical protein